MFNTRRDCLSAIVTEMVRFLSHVAAFEHRFSDTDLERVRQYVEWAYNQLGLPSHGSVPQFSLIGYLGGDFIPDISRSSGLELFRRNPFDRTIRRHFSGWCKVPARSGECDYKDEEARLFPGEKWIGRKTRLVAWLNKLGYVEDRKLHIELVGDQALLAVLREYMDPLSLPPNLYEFSVLSLPPVLRT